jgi:cob(I)alamin adenosyltransferase
MKIYTKTGDTGETGLFGGPRVRKDAARVEAYGAVDELNAALGVTRSEELPGEIDALLARMQNELFDLGAELATPDPQKHHMTRIGAEQIGWQEAVIDRYDGQLPPLKQFILPAGTRAAAYLHLARCVCRRAERRIVTLAEREPISADLIVYVNRLSDLLFVLARAANQAAGVADVPWEKR